MSKIDINQADLATLARLNGIGDKLASRIITYRETVHPFEETIELAAVPGISERMVRALEEEITVAPPEEEAAGAAGAEVAVAEVAGVEAADIVLLAEVQDEIEEDGEEAFARPEEETVPAVEEVLLEEEKVAPAAPPDEEQLPDFAQATRPAAGVVEETAPSPPARARSCAGYLLTALFAALLGAAGALLLLFALNGTLDFARARQLDRLQNQAAEQGQGQERLVEELDALSTRVGRAAAAEATTAAGMAETEANVAGLEEGLSGLDEEVATLAAESAALSTRVNTLSAAAENFDLFLGGVQELLIDLQGYPTPPTATPTGTATPTVAPGTRTPTPRASATATPLQTRTPRPTATPFVTPTPTAGNGP